VCLSERIVSQVSNCSRCISGQVSRELAAIAVCSSCDSGARYHMGHFKNGARVTPPQHAPPGAARTEREAVATEKRRWRSYEKALQALCRPRLLPMRPLQPLSSSCCKYHGAKSSSFVLLLRKSRVAGVSPCRPIIPPTPPAAP